MAVVIHLRISGLALMIQVIMRDPFFLWLSTLITVPHTRKQTIHNPPQFVRRRLVCSYHRTGLFDCLE